MNLYNLHSDPSSLHKHDQRYDTVPKMIEKQFEDPDFEVNKQQLATIVKNAYLSYSYANEVLNQHRFPLGEKAIIADPEWAIEYARNVIKGRFPEAEAEIAYHPYYAHIYAKYVIKGRFPEAEEEIAKWPSSAILYAKEIIHGKWPPGEKAMAEDPKFKAKYNEYLNNIGYKVDEFI